jgi:hypothetical protein
MRRRIRRNFNLDISWCNLNITGVHEIQFTNIYYVQMLVAKNKKYQLQSVSRFVTFFKNAAVISVWRVLFLKKICLEIIFYYDRFEILTAVTVKSTVFWDVAPCSMVEVYQRFR